jgi:hypothetical protein
VVGQSGPSLTTQSEPDAAVGVVQSTGRSGPGVGHVRNPLGEELLRTGPIAAEETTDLEPELDRSTLPWKIVQRASIAAVDAPRDVPAFGAGTGRAAGLDDEGHLIGVNQDVLELQGLGIGEQDGW